VGLIEAAGLTNVRIYPEDVRPLLDRLKPGSLAGIYVLFADPWPKKRHADRRFIGPGNLPKLARVLRKDGVLRVATDDPTLQAWTDEQLKEAPDFTPAPGQLPERPADWPPTRYEQKAIKAKRVPKFWIYRRV
jgi:tRNA (guanine-N7-)-methyltransferase